MPEAAQLARAQLHQLDANFESEIKPEKSVTVQFNPETLKVTFANQLQTPSGAGDQTGTPARQYVGAGTTKLAVQLWFDVTAPQPEGETADDVRKLTQKVAYFITPAPADDDPTKFLPPAVRFAWGTFQFDGLMESLEETLEFFSPDGRPLRASLSLALSQQKITAFQFRSGGAPAGLGGGAPGVRPLAQAPAGATLQGLAAAQGRGADWQSIAAANGIENPRQLAPGQLIDLNAGR